SETSFRISRNYFQTSYAIEGARNNLEIDGNVFEFEITADGGNLLTNFGAVPVPGPTSFTNNLVVNPGRGLFATNGVYNNLTFDNNLVIGNQTINPRTEGLIGLKAADNQGNTTDFSTINVNNNIVELRGLERPLFRNPESFAANVGNNELIGISDAGEYENPETDEARGPLQSLQFHVGVGGSILIDGDAIAERARNAELPAEVDDDGDGILDVFDPAPRDSHNGLRKLLGPGQSIELDFELPDGTSPLDSATGLSGINTNPDALSTFYDFDAYGVLTSENATIANGRLQVETGNGDSFNDRNDSSDDYGFMFDARGSDVFVLSSRVILPDSGLPQASAAAIGIQLGDGTQESYVKFTRSYGGGGNRLEVRWDDSDAVQDAVPSSSQTRQSISLSAELAAAQEYVLAFRVDRTNPNTILMTPLAKAYASDGMQVGSEIVGETFEVTGRVADAINGSNQSLQTIDGEASNGGLFVGVYSTDYSDPFNKVPSFQARWEYLNVVSEDAFADTFNNGSAYLRLYLYDADRDERLMELTNQVPVDRAVHESRNLTIVAFAQNEDRSAEIGSVQLALGGRRRIQNDGGYALFGKRNDDYRPGKGIDVGENLISISVFDSKRGKGRLLENFELEFTLL
ncbi:MAG: hypothetical protein AAGG44_19065, partial [Planctomycetota bacterium]